MTDNNFQTVLSAFVRWQSVNDHFIQEEPINEEEEQLYQVFDKAADVYIGMGVELYERITERMLVDSDVCVATLMPFKKEDA